MRSRHLVLVALLGVAADGWAGTGTLVGVEHFGRTCKPVGGPITVSLVLNAAGDWSASFHGYPLKGTSSSGPDSRVFRLALDFLSTIAIENVMGAFNNACGDFASYMGFADGDITASLKINKLRTAARFTVNGQGLGTTVSFTDRKQKYKAIATGPWAE